MTAFRQALALQATRASRHLISSRSVVFASRSTPARSYATTTPRRQNLNAFSSQLEDPAVSNFLQSSKPPAVENPQTMVEKIVQKHAVGLAPGKKVKAGDYVTIKPSKMMSHDNTSPIMSKVLKIMPEPKIHDPEQLVFALDHDVTNKTKANLDKYQKIQDFASKHGVQFYPAGTGIGHQLMVERGHAWPGTLSVASDSHSNHLGGISTLGTPVVRTDGASVWLQGRTWWQVPSIAKVNLIGALPPGVTAKDIIVSLCGLFNQDEVLNHAIEFAGPGAKSLSIDERLTCSNMTTEWGCLAAIWPMDATLEKWLRAKADLPVEVKKELGIQDRFTHERIDELMANPIEADQGAEYAKELFLNLSSLSPYVSGPDTVKTATPVRDLEAKDIKINKAYLVSCTNSRASDIAAAARVVREASEKGQPAKFADHVEFYMAAASKFEQQAAEKNGDWQVLLDAGAKPLVSGCGPCIGLGTGLMEDGDTSISCSNRNYKGRMGSRNASTYLSSPQVVAASALQGKIAGPGWYEKPEGIEKVILGEGSGDEVADHATSIEDALDRLIAQADNMIAEAEKSQEGEAAAAAEEESGEEALTEILPGFPEKIEGEIVFCDQDNLSTDGIYAGKYTYQDGMTTEDQARVCMENYDPEFGNISREGDILVGGNNFGTGSSREQAATAILARNIPLVVAGSFGNIFSRNSINNALMTVEVPKLVERLREAFKAEGNDKVLTRRTGWKLNWDLKRSKVTVTESDGKSWSVKVGELPPNVQDVIAKGGLEKWIKAQIEK